MHKLQRVIYWLQRSIHKIHCSIYKIQSFIHKLQGSKQLYGITSETIASWLCRRFFSRSFYVDRNVDNARILGVQYVVVGNAGVVSCQLCVDCIVVLAV